MALDDLHHFLQFIIGEDTFAADDGNAVGEEVKQIRTRQWLVLVRSPVRADSMALRFTKVRAFLNTTLVSWKIEKCTLVCRSGR